MSEPCDRSFASGWGLPAFCARERGHSGPHRSVSGKEWGPSDTTMPATYKDGHCPCCGGSARVLNGAWFRWFREKRGLSLRAAARRGGVSASFVSDFERGRRAWSDRLEKVYGLKQSPVRAFAALRAPSTQREE